jgi:hypothetical protein
MQTSVTKHYACSVFDLPRHSYLSIFETIADKTNTNTYPISGSYTLFSCMFVYLHDIMPIN